MMQYIGFKKRAMGQPRMLYIGFKKRQRNSPGCSILASRNEEGGQPRMLYIGFKKRGRRTAQDAVYWLEETRKEDSPG